MSVAGTPAVVSVSISSSLNSFRALKRYARGLTIAEFKCKLELVVGSPASCMELELYTPDDKFVMKLDRDEALLGSYPVDDGYRIHVIDRSGATIGEYEDVSRVEKFQISDTEYDKRADSARSFMKRSHLGQYNKEEMSRKESELEQKLVEEKALAEAIPVGARCEVRVSGQPSKRGTVMYVGLTEFKPGYLVGIKYDEPLGKHDGSVNGKQYFECLPKYGAFVKPQCITMGDFPEEDYGLDDEIGFLETPPEQRPMGSESNAEKYLNVLSDHVGGVSFPACTGKSEAAPSGQPRIPRRWKGREPLCPDRLCLCSGFMARHSRLQREVLGLYRQFLRACRGKPGFLPRVQAEFRRGARIPRTDVLLIEYLLRRGQRQLAQLREGHATRMGFFAPGRLQQQQQQEKGEDAQS